LQARWPLFSASSGSTPGGFPDDLCSNKSAGGEPGNHGFIGGHAAGTPIRANCRRNADDFTSQLGATGITLQFDLDRDINAASRDVQAAINAAAGQLPAGLPSLPNYRRINPAEVDILDLTVSSDTVPRGRLYDFVRFLSRAKIAQVDGVGLVRISGGAKPAFAWT